MSFPRYPAYKDTGVEWLGEVPEHWEAIRLKNALKCRITDGPHTTPEFVDEGVPFLSVDGIQEGELVFDGCRYVSEADHSEFQKKASPMRDDILMGKAASTGKIARVKTDLAFSIWSPLALIRVNGSHLAPSFCEYFLKSHSAQAQIDILCTSNTQKNISMDDIPRLAMTRPPIEEQVAIATFLDRETAKIDALIAEQQRLIELLQEKRQAVISHAVTKGLNPDAPMKDSGVEWLGEVPEHWEVCALSHTLTAIGDVDHYMPETVAEGVPYLMTGDLQALTSQIDSHECKQVSPDEYEKLSRKIKTAKGDLIVARYATIGTVAYVDIDRDLLVSYSCVTIKPDSGVVDGMFLFFCLKSDSFAQGLKCKVNANTQENVGIGDLKKVRVAIPPYNEQQQIYEYLQNATSGMTDVIQASQDTVRLLQERRSALISAAVTGQIDVRGLMPEVSAA